VSAKRSKGKANAPSRRRDARLSPTEALRLLLPAYSAHESAERLNVALRTNVCRLWCNGKLLDPSYIRTHLVVQVRTEADGRWRADIESAIREPWIDVHFDWRFSAAGVAALLPRPSDRLVEEPRRKPGKKAKDDWPLLVAAKLIHIARYDPDALENADALVKPLKEFLLEEIGWAPSDPKQVREKIVFLLQFVRR
jgi:hypothetical protein